MDNEVNMSDLRENLSAYLDAVERGKTITITRRGKPSAVLSAVQEAPQGIDLARLQAFRDNLGVSLEENAVVKMRKEERY